MESYAQHGRDTLYMGARKKLLGQRKAGEEFPAEVSIAKLDTDEGMFFGVIVRDATEWFDAQRSLTEALKAEESANRAKSAFLATVSHEIRTPLNGILGMAQVFDQASLTPVQLRQFEVIRQSAEDLLDIVNDVLDLSKIEAGKLEIDDTDFDLEALIGAVHDVFGDLARQKGLDFRLETDDLAGRFRGDPTRIRQVLYNLVSNAVKFTAEGEIRLSAARQGDRLVLEVKDTGEGISAEAQRRLFKPFMQADNSVTRKHGGTGLGLAICRRLVDLMGGVISVRSRPGQGSTFRVELPLNMVQAAEAEAESPLAGGEIDVAADIPALRVLAAEDNPANRLVLKAVLQSFSIEPAFAENGEEAVAHWLEGAYDIVFMDIQMPKLSGVDATREIRTREGAEGRPRSFIVGLTANAFHDQHAAYRAAGMDDVLTKPLELARIHEALQQAVLRRRQSRGAAAAAL